MDKMWLYIQYAVFMKQVHDQYCMVSSKNEFIISVFKYVQLL